MNFDAWKARDVGAENDRTGEHEYQLEAKLEEYGCEIQRLTEQAAAARALMMQALKLAESGVGMPYLKLDSLLTRAIGELGCVSCGKAIPADHMQYLSVCREHCVCMTGDCYARERDRRIARDERDASDAHVRQLGFHSHVGVYDAGRRSR